jgi:uncharacterized OB-fold protein
MFQMVDEFFDEELGQHVLTLKDENGTKHVLQIQIAHMKCPTCGTLFAPPEGDIDPKAFAEQALKEANASSDRVTAYRRKHRLRTTPKK